MNRQAIGVGVIVVRGGDILFGLRRGAHGADTWSFPGGHLDGDERAEACALCELSEETGLAAVDPRVVAETNDDFPEGLRYRTLFVRVNWSGGEPLVREPEACERWGWFVWDEPPRAAVPAGRQSSRHGVPPMTRPHARARDTDPRLETSAPLRAPVGVVEAIHIASAAGAPTRPLEVVRARAGIGLEGDRYGAGKGHYADTRVSRDLTLIEAEAIEALARDHGIALAPGETRRNITTRDIRLNDFLGQRFWVGDVLCEGTRLCEPCEYLADLTGKPLLRPLVHRGGLRADILEDGVIRQGDHVCAADEN